MRFGIKRRYFRATAQLYGQRQDVWMRTILLLIAMFILPGGVLAAEQAPIPAPTKELDKAVVEIDGVKLFELRGITAYPAKQRVSDIEKRIEAVARDPAIPVSSVRDVIKDDRVEIYAGKKRLLTIVPADAVLNEVEPKIFGEIVVHRIREAIERYRLERTSQRLLTNGAYVLGATVLFVLLVWGIRIVFRRSSDRAHKRLEGLLGAISFRSIQFLDANQVKAAAHAVFNAIRFLLILAVTYVYLQFALGMLPWTRSISVVLIDMVIHPLRIMGTGLLSRVDDIIFLIILYFVIRYILSLLRVLFSAIRGGRLTLTGFEPEWAWPTYRLIRLLVLAFAVVVAYPYIPGSSSDAFKGVSLFLGVLFSLGSTSVISNVIAGYTMTYRRAFTIGDRVKIGETIGDVDEIRLLVTHLRSLKNEKVVIPNSTILNKEITNYSALARENGLILHTTVGIGYEVPWRQVEAMLLQAAKSTAGILTEPHPFVLQKLLGDFAVNYELNCYCDDAQKMFDLYTALHESIQDTFNEYGVQIMTPAYRSDTPQPKIVPKDNWYAAPAEPPDVVSKDNLTDAPTSSPDVEPDKAE